MPIFGPLGTVIAALTCPYTLRLDKTEAPAQPQVLKRLISAGRDISTRGRRSLNYAHHRYPSPPDLSRQIRLSPLDGVPPLKRQWDAPSYWSEAETLGIETALHMEVGAVEQSPEAETHFVLGLDRRIVGTISQGRPEDPDFPGCSNALQPSSRSAAFAVCCRTIPTTSRRPAPSAPTSSGSPRIG